MTKTSEHTKEMCTRLRTKADIPLMYVQLLRKLMIYMYGILNGSSPSYMNTMFMPVSSKYDMRDKKKLQLPKYNIWYDMGKTSLNIKGRSNGTKFLLILNKLRLFMILNVI